MPPASIEATYQKLTDLEHVLTRPDTYIGSIDKCKQEGWFVNADGNAMERREEATVPGLLKCFDEALVNARDHQVRMAESGGAPVKCIEVDIDRAAGRVTIRNDGAGIDVAMHPQHQLWVPEMIFAHMRSSTNYSDQKAKTVGGRNGFGIKLAFAWSTESYVETVDATRGLKFRQEYGPNLSNKSKPTVIKSKVKPYTKVSFVLDWARVGLAQMSPGLEAAMQRRVYDIAAVTDATVRVKYNGTALPVRSFESFVTMFVGAKGEAPRVFESSGKGRWEYAVALSPSDEFDHVSFVNGINTRVGGTHVKSLLAQITRKLAAYIETKKGVKVKPAAIKEQLWLFVNAVIDDPAFDSQTKDCLQTAPSKFGSTPTVSDKFIEKVAKMGVMDVAVSLNAVKEKADAKKSDGKKSTRVRGIPKLVDANFAGGVKSAECTLVLAEGDSAKAGVLSGLSREARNTVGVYPLRGKLLNVRCVGQKKLNDNAECSDIKKILGLVTGAEYTRERAAKDLRYGSITIMTDQDPDGSHIKGLVFNFIETQWPSLLAIPGFLRVMVTPLIKATKGAQVKSFYSERARQLWSETTDAVGNWKFKYYKGLGTSTGKEFREYFADPKVARYVKSDGCSEALQKVFDPKLADDRKIWLEAHDIDAVLDPSAERVEYREFVEKELRHFSVYDCERSVPGIDGLKPSQRKVLYAARKRGLTTEMKVAQFAGYVAEHAAYHHGEVSLMKTIVGMAAEYVGSNNVALLEPLGQFGTRLQGGKDSASERYIFTRLSPVTAALFPAADDPVLPRVDDDGTPVEPEYYMPVVPYHLLNGARGIGTGFSSDVPAHDPMELVRATRTLLDGGSPAPIAPSYADFTGTVASEPGGKYVVRGNASTIGADTVRVTELPVGTWTEDFKARLEKLASEQPNARVKHYSDLSTDRAVDITIEFARGQLQKLTPQALEKLLGLSSVIRTSNMHAFDEHKRIKRHPTALDILKRYLPLRLATYSARREHEMEALAKVIKTLSNKARFVRQQLADELVLRGLNKQEANALLREMGYDAEPEATAQYGYLLGMSFDALLEENATKLEQEREHRMAKKAELEAKGPRDLWLEDLSAFEAAYAKYAAGRTARSRDDADQNGKKKNKGAKKR